jgi:hypothetical protein
MSDEERVATFREMVRAAERLIKPWRIALIVSNALWFAVVALFILRQTP